MEEERLERLSSLRILQATMNIFLLKETKKY